MALIEVVTDDIEYDRLRRSILNGAKSRYLSGQPGFTRITEVDLKEAENAEDSVWIVTARDLRPGDVRPKGVIETKYYDFEDFDLIREELPEIRAKDLPPFRENLDAEDRRPETDVGYASSYVILRPNAAAYLVHADGFDYDGLEDDLYAIQNEATWALDASAREGIWQTTREKRQARKIQRDLDHRLNLAWQEYTGQNPDHAFGVGALSPSQKVRHLEDLMGRGARETNWAREQGLSLDDLKIQAVVFDHQAEEAEEVGKGAFEETLRTEGMTMPDSFGAAEEATERLGLGTREYLGL